MLLSESTHNSREVREKMVELMFEKFNCPALFLAKAAVLNSFAVAKQTSLVVDAGYMNTTGKGAWRAGTNVGGSGRRGVGTKGWHISSQLEGEGRGVVEERMGVCSPFFKAQGSPRFFCCAICHVDAKARCSFRH